MCVRMRHAFGAPRGCRWRIPAARFLVDGASSRNPGGAMLAPVDATHGARPGLSIAPLTQARHSSATARLPGQPTPRARAHGNAARASSGQCGPVVGSGLRQVHSASQLTNVARGPRPWCWSTVGPSMRSRPGTPPSPWPDVGEGSPGRVAVAECRCRWRTGSCARLRERLARTRAAYNTMMAQFLDHGAVAGVMRRGCLEVTVFPL